MLPNTHGSPKNHTFHIPVMGLGFSIDTPIKVARFGISSVVSIMEDQLIEKMRELHSMKNGLPYTLISTKEEDHRAKRITAYLDLLDLIVDKQMDDLRNDSFEHNGDLLKYFELLPDNSRLKALYIQMTRTLDREERTVLQEALKAMTCPVTSTSIS